MANEDLSDTRVAVDNNKATLFLPDEDESTDLVTLNDTELMNSNQDTATVEKSRNNTPPQHNIEIFIDQIAEERLKDTANLLLQSTIPRPEILVIFQNDIYQLFADDKFDPGSTHWEYHGSRKLYKGQLMNIKFLHAKFSDLISEIRKVFESNYGRLPFQTNEIVCRIPSLDLIISEDNVYGERITLQDVYNIYQILSERSKVKEDFASDVIFSLEIELQSRFVSKYNALVELTENDGTLENIKPFKNNPDSPLVLSEEDSSQTTNLPLINVTNDAENNTKFFSGVSSDELLEIISD